MSYLILALAGLLSGGIVFGAKVLALNGATPFELMLFPSLIGTLIFLPIVGADFRKVLRVPFAVTAIYVFSVLAVTIGEYVPLYMNVSVTLVLLLVYMQPVWTILIERFYFHRKIPASSWLLVGLMVFGLLLLINPFRGLHFSLLGIVLPLLAGFGESLWIFVTQYFSKQGIKPLTNYWCTCFYAALPLGILYFVANDYYPRQFAGLDTLSFDLSPHLWISFFIYSLLIYTPANTLIFLGNKNVPAGIIGMILLLEPVVGITLDVIFLHNPLTWNLIAGGIIILAANILLIKKNSSLTLRRHAAAVQIRPTES